MSILLIASFAYLTIYLKRIVTTKKSVQTQRFSDVRQAEIKEELNAGRLSQDEAKQLSDDLRTEVDLTSQQINLVTYDNSVSHFSVQVFATFTALTLLGAIALYQLLGFSNEVEFTDKLQKGEITQTDMSSFLSYRAQKYQRAQDWYWLGKDHLNQGDYLAAEQAFANALDNLTGEQQDELAILIDYSQSLFFANEKKPNKKLETVLARMLTIDPNQADALGLQGVIAFDKQDFNAAVLLWQKAILAGVDFAERASLLEGIARAREAGNITAEQIPELITHRLKVRAVVETPEKLTPDALFLVYAKTASQPMPVAIKRVLPSQLDNVIELTNLDNLMPGLTLKDLSRVDVVVKLTSVRARDLTEGADVATIKNLKVNSGKTVDIAIQL